MRPVVAIDLGGTNIRAAYYPDGTPPSQSFFALPTPASEGPQAVIAQIHATIEGLAIPASARAELAIGIGAPGPLNPDTGVVLDAPNLAGWNHVPLADWIRQRWGCPVYLQNDANLAALGEWAFGAGRGVDDLVMLTLGTGIGGGVIVAGRLLEGSAGLAGELGHLPVSLDGPICSCGRPGHLEAFASGTAIAVEVERRGGLARHAHTGPATTAEIAAAAAAGDPTARAVMTDAVRALSVALAGLVHIFNPNRIVLGGGVARAGESFLQEIDSGLRAALMHPAFGRDLTLVGSALGDEAGLLGALALVDSRA